MLSLETSRFSLENKQWKGIRRVGANRKILTFYLLHALVGLVVGHGVLTGSTPGGAVDSSPTIEPGFPERLQMDFDRSGWQRKNTVE